MGEDLLSKAENNEMHYSTFCHDFIELFEKDKKLHQLDASDLGFSTPAHMIVDMLKEMKHKYMEGIDEIKDFDRRKIDYAIEKLNAKQSLYSIDQDASWMRHAPPKIPLNHDHNEENKLINEEIRKS